MSGPCTPLGSRTTVLQLCKPASGEFGWDTSVNGNMDVLDGLFTGVSILKAANGGTQVDGSAAANGKLLIGNGAGYTLALPTGSASITVTAGAGTLALDTSQNISTAGSPTFAALTVVGSKAFSQFFPAANFCQVVSTTTLPIVVRFAANNYGLSRTAGGAETLSFGATLPLPFSATALKGTNITSIVIVQQITVAALTSNTFNDISKIVYANNVANAVTQWGAGLSISMPTATQANPYSTTGTVNTPAFMVTPNAQLCLDWTVVMQNTGVYALYGIIVNYSEASL
jgi:hypothetical protein